MEIEYYSIEVIKQQLLPSKKLSLYPSINKIIARDLLRLFQLKIRLGFTE